MENVDGRVYFHVPRASAREIALLSLWHLHPGRMHYYDLVAAVVRHHFSEANARLAVARLRRVFDQDDEGRLRLLLPGMRAADELMASAVRRTRDL